MVEVAPVFKRLEQHCRSSPVIVAHRGDSANFPENTLPAFASALQLGVLMQEFDVRQTRDGMLVCVHDATLGRTSDADARLGPGALVAQCTWDEVRTLDAGSWHGQGHRGITMPRLTAVLDLLAPDCVAMIEHKAGTAASYVDAVRLAGATERCVLQSFDWAFVTAANQLAPELAYALLGPTDGCPDLDTKAIEAARTLGVGMLHWDARQVTARQVARCHEAGLLVCTYTTDDELCMCGGARIGIDAMCTNVPRRMIELRDAGLLRREV